MAKRVHILEIAKALDVPINVGTSYLHDSFAEHGKVDENECVAWTTVVKYINANWRTNGSAAKQRRINAAWPLFDEDN